MTNKPKLDVHWEISEGSVCIEYSVRNTTASVIYLVNVLTTYDKDRGRVPNPAEAYVFIESVGRIEFGKRIPRVPDGRFVHPYTWFVTCLVPDEKFTEKLNFALPLRENRPYLSYVGRPLPDVRRIACTAVFALGYLAEHPSLKPTKQVENGVEVLRVANPLLMPPPSSDASIPEEQMVESQPIDMQIDVIPLPPGIGGGTMR